MQFSHLSSADIRLICLAVLLSLIAPFDSVAQDSKELYTVSNVVPPSPNVSAMVQYGRTPIGTYTGTANISIPIYEVSIGDLSFPITLSYSGTGGIKVGDIASWTGLGWTLNVGGAITRQVRGVPDETDAGIMSPGTRSQFLQYLSTGSVSNLLVYYENITDGLTDSEPDMYYYSFGGNDGRFLYDDTARFMQIPYNNNKIEMVIHGGQTGWKITDLKGNEFYFLTKEYSDYYTVIKTGATATIAPITPYNNFISSWNLTFAVNKTSKDTIHFEYEGSNYTNRTMNSATRNMLQPNSTGGCGPSVYVENMNHSTTNALLLKTIRFRNGVIHFTREATQREDLLGTYALKSITVNNLLRDLLKVDFRYRYTATTYPSDLNASYGKRLVLDSVHFFKGGARPESYAFQYSAVHLPHRLSYSQDHWGYYNGKTNAYFTPETYVLNTGGTFHIEGADKNPDTAFTQAGVLKKITYPTGGYTELEYENNRVDTLPDDFDVKFSDKVFNLYGDPSGQIDYYQQTFTVNEQYLSTTGTFGFLFGNFGCTSSGGGGTGFDCPNVTLKYPNGTTQQINQNNYDKEYFLPNGTYIVTANFSHIPDPGVKATRISSFSFSMRWRESYKGSAQNKNIVVGGLRVRKISDYDNTGIKNVRQFSYTRFGSSTVSSGRLLNAPKYSYEYRQYQPGLVNCVYFCVSSASQITLANTQSSFVGYEQVTELNGQDGTFGKIEYEYYYPGNNPDNIPPVVPFPPVDSWDYNRGQLRKQRIYRWNGAAYDLVREIRNQYQAAPIKSARGVKVSKVTNREAASLDDYRVAVYTTYSGARLLSSDTTLFYGTSVNDKLLTTNLYGYNLSNLLINFHESTDSRGTVNVLRKKFPSDYTGLTTTDDLTKGVKFLYDNYFLSTEVEVAYFRKDLVLNKENLLKSALNVYRPTAPLKSKIMVLETPSELGDFNISTVQAGKVVHDSRYKDEYIFSKYDQYANSVERRQNNHQNTCYIWDYNYAYPVAEAVGADSVSVAYTSFETGVTGSWSVPSAARVTTAAVTGSKSYSLSNGAISRSGLTSATKYIVSYWSTSATALTVTGTQGTASRERVYNGWYYYEHIVTGTAQVTVSGSGNIDELRLYPQGTAMTTYTYDPLLGMQTQSDVNGQLSFYEYDPSGRLRLVRDTDGRILKHFDYQHSVPVTQ